MNFLTSTDLKPHRPALLRDGQCGLNLFLIVLFIIGISIFMMVMPKYADDLWFLNESAQWMKERGVWFADDGVNIFRYGLPTQEMLETITIHQNCDTGRMANIAAVPILMLPKWLGSLVSVAMWILAVYYSLRIAKVSLHDSRLIWFSLIYWTVMVPWPSHFGSIMYQFNYIVPSGLSISLCYLILNPPKSKAGLAVTFLLALLVGTWHEGFSVPIGFALTVCMIFFRSWRNRNNLIILICMFVGFASMAISPGFVGRADRTLFSNLRELGHFVRTIFHNPFYLIMLGYVAAEVWRKGRGWINRHTAIIFFLLGGLVSFSLELATYAERRVSMWCVMSTLLAMLLALKEYTPANRKENNTARKTAHHVSMHGLLNGALSVFLFAGAVLCMVKWGYTDYYTFRVRNDFRQIIAKYNANPDKPVFMDVPTFYTAPLICGFTPCFGYIHIPFYLNFANLYYAKSENQPLIMIPEELRRVTGTEGTPVGGDLGIRSIGKHLYAPLEKVSENKDLKFTEFKMDIDFGLFRKQKVDTGIFAFESEADGRKYVFLVPYSGFIPQKLLDVKAIERSGNDS